MLGIFPHFSATICSKNICHTFNQSAILQILLAINDDMITIIGEEKDVNNVRIFRFLVF